MGNRRRQYGIALGKSPRQTTLNHVAGVTSGPCSVLPQGLASTQSTDLPVLSPVVLEPRLLDGRGPFLRRVWTSVSDYRRDCHDCSSCGIGPCRHRHRWYWHCVRRRTV